ncbi:MAG: hypothetical protein KAU26_09570 [Methylococcales bacterium]|nr:hypothetical protein [Methylococcales bacterium]
MTHAKTYLKLTALCFFSIGAFSIGTITPAVAESKAASTHTEGKVIDIINVTSYTYVQVQTKKSKVWVAAPTTDIKKGAVIRFSTKMPMENFHSDSIDKTFPIIYFVNRLTSDADANKTASTKKSSPHTKTKSTGKKIVGIEKVKNGKTITEIYAEKEALKTKIINIRGKVTRFSADIMGSNWLHVQDSSSTKDLTVTTKAKVAVGDIVIIEGKLSVNKDFGHGYVYPVIVEDAKITKEK